MFITRLRLSNIGRFEDFDISFRARWNLIVGSNDVGKSTVLRALGAAMSVDRSFFGQAGLLCSDTDDGEILVDFVFRQEGSRRSGVVHLKLRRSGDGVEFDVLRDDYAAADLELRQPAQDPFLVVGYGPYRGLDFPGPEPGSAVEHPKERATCGLLRTPLLAIDQVKALLIQWETRASKDGEAEVLLSFDKLWDLLTPLLSGVSFSDIDMLPGGMEVFVHSSGHRVPLHCLGEGNRAVICCVGDLLQRLSLLPAEGPLPWKRRFVVLLDEIDVHLHPRWQRELVDGLRSLFPRAQFIATTHAPLLLSAAKRGEVILLEERAGRVVPSREPPSIQGWAVDEILESRYFGMLNTPRTRAYKRARQTIEVVGLDRGSLARRRQRCIGSFEKRLELVEARDRSNAPDLSRLLRELDQLLRETRHGSPFCSALAFCFGDRLEQLGQSLTQPGGAG